MGISEVINYGKRFGEIEASIEKANCIEIIFENGKLKIIKNLEGEILNVRITKGKKYGYCSTTAIDNWKKVVRKAFELSRVNKELEILPKLPEKQKYFDVIEDKRIKELKEEDLISIGKEIIDFLKKKKIKCKELIVKRCSENVTIGNSSNLLASDESNHIEISLAAEYKDYILAESFCRRKLFNVTDELQFFVDKIKIGSKPKKIKNLKCKAIFDYWALENLFCNFCEWIRGDSLYFKRTPLEIGKVIGNEKLNIIDNGIYPFGLYSSKFDSEGVSRRRTKIVEEGIVKNFLFDSYTSQLFGTTSTGNCSSLGKRPSIEVSNLIIQKGDNSVDELFKEVDKGIFVEAIYGHSFPITGDITSTITGFYIENGKLKHGLRNVIINTNFFKLLENIAALSNKYRQDSYLVSPLILFENVNFYQS